ncbi:transcription factor E4F1-like [Culicoides brevitarsis]|uniref:transcription factor E4F1-like n=1 Tax=Culicoides brevitarsis TaxID=469753 RepID=UPI00307CC352
METTCVGCNTKSYGMIGIYKHPKKLDEMFTELSGFEVLTDDYLCIQCYEDLKTSLDFKRKIENCCRGSRKRIINIPHDDPLIEQIDTGGEYEVLISSTSTEQNVLVPQSTVATTKNEKKSPKVTKIGERKSLRKSAEKKSNETPKEIELILSCEDFEAEEPSFKLFDSAGDVVEETEVSDFVDEEPENDESSTSKDKKVIKNHKCQYCSKLFRSKQALEGHHRSHTGSKPFICEYCQKGFAEMGNLRQHVNSIHLNQRKYSCEKCKKTFKTHYSHKVHTRSCITKEKPYKCQYCEKGFYSSGKLQLHTRTHTNERPYPCPHCSSKFKDSTGLKRHVGRVHSESSSKVKNERILEEGETSESQN